MAADFLNKGAVKAFPGRYFDDPGGIYGVKSTKAIGWQPKRFRANWVPVRVKKTRQNAISAAKGG
jgi:hypothetical protein